MGPEAVRAKALAELREALVHHVGAHRGHLALKTIKHIVPVDVSGLEFRAVDASRPSYPRTVRRTGPENTCQSPSNQRGRWKCQTPTELVTTTLRQRNLTRTYAQAMTLIVIVLTVFASFQLALGHVVHKSRDVGVLLTNGAGRSAIFAIFLSQIGAMVLVGCVLGALIAFGAAPGLEEIARKLMHRLLAAVPEQGEAAVEHVLDLDVATLAVSAAWVMVSAIGGALVPVIQSTRIDPLSSLGKGD